MAITLSIFLVSLTIAILSATFFAWVYAAHKYKEFKRNELQQFREDNEIRTIADLYDSADEEGLD